MSSARHSKRAAGWSSQRDILDQRLAPATLTNYRREFKQFLVYLEEQGVDLEGPPLGWEDMDDFMSNLIEDAYNTKRFSYSKLNTMYWSICYFCPLAASRRLLPRSFALLKAWHASKPLALRIPCPWFVVLNVARVAAEWGLWREAIAFVTLGHSWLRVGNVLSLLKEDVLHSLQKVNPKFPYMLLHLRKTKTAVERAVSVTRADVAKLLVSVMWHTRPRKKIFPFSYHHISALFRRILASLGLQQFNWTIHCVRAGGATEARLLGWSMEAIKERALWESSKSADHYIRMSLGLNVFHLLSKEIISWGNFFDKNVCSIFDDF